MTLDGWQPETLEPPPEQLSQQAKPLRGVSKENLRYVVRQ